MLSSFTIENFKSYHEASPLKLAPLTVLIGANAAGKSNAVEALRLLSWIAAGNRLGTIRHALQEKERTIRGKVGDVAFRGARSFSFSCRTTDPDWNHYSITLEIREGEELHVAGERLTGSGKSSAAPLFEVVTPSQGSLGNMDVAYNNFVRGRNPRIPCSDQTAVLCQLMSPAPFHHGDEKAQKEIPAATSRFHRQLADVTFLDPRPSLMRGYGFKTERHLTRSGANLSGVLYNLCRETETKQELLEFVRALPEQDVTAIDFIETARGEVMLGLRETFGGRTTSYDATLLSDGTLRVLAVAAAILSAARGRLVVIEEIDNGVHPSRAARLLDQVSRIAKAHELRVLISSHNPALLDALPDDAAPHAVFCYRHPEDGSSRLVRLMDLPDYPELAAQGSIGHLMTEGIIERFVKQRPDPEERKRRAHAWLNELRRQTG